jgi:hypothetical protein
MRACRLAAKPPAGCKIREIRGAGFGRGFGTFKNGLPDLCKQRVQECGLFLPPLFRLGNLPFPVVHARYCTPVPAF